MWVSGCKVARLHVASRVDVTTRVEVFFQKREGFRFVMNPFHFCFAKVLGICTVAEQTKSCILPASPI